jgi:hypothetical protein
MLELAAISLAVALTPLRPLVLIVVGIRVVYDALVACSRILMDTVIGKILRPKVGMLHKVIAQLTVVG